jgi:hypothetical protein
VWQVLRLFVVTGATVREALGAFSPQSYIVIRETLDEMKLTLMF